MTKHRRTDHEPSAAYHSPKHAPRRRTDHEPSVRGTTEQKRAIVVAGLAGSPAFA